MQQKGNQEAYIRNEWFANHKATQEVLTNSRGEPIVILDWSSPNSGRYAVRYLLEQNYVFASGDMGEAAFCLTEKATLEKLSKYDLRYFYGKLSCISGGDQGVEFDSETAKQAIRDSFEEHFNAAGKPTTRGVKALLRAADESSSTEYWSHQCGKIDDEVDLERYDDGWWEWLPNCGSVYSNSLVAFHIGLKMAYQQLSQEGEDKRNE